MEENFVKKDKRLSRGVKQENLHVLRMNAMPSILIETGFVNNYEDAHYISTEEGQQSIAESIYNAITSYKKLVDRNVKEPQEKHILNLLDDDFKSYIINMFKRLKEPCLKN